MESLAAQGGWRLRGGRRARRVRDLLENPEGIENPEGLCPLGGDLVERRRPLLLAALAAFGVLVRGVTCRQARVGRLRRSMWRPGLRGVPSGHGKGSAELHPRASPLVLHLLRRHRRLVGAREAGGRVEVAAGRVEEAEQMQRRGHRQQREQRHRELQAEAQNKVGEPRVRGGGARRHLGRGGGDPCAAAAAGGRRGRQSVRHGVCGEPPREVPRRQQRRPLSGAEGGAGDGVDGHSLCRQQEGAGERHHSGHGGGAARRCRRRACHEAQQAPRHQQHGYHRCREGRHGEHTRLPSGPARSTPGGIALDAGHGGGLVHGEVGDQQRRWGEQQLLGWQQQRVCRDVALLGDGRLVIRRPPTAARPATQQPAQPRAEVLCLQLQREAARIEERRAVQQRERRERRRADSAQRELRAT